MKVSHYFAAGLAIGCALFSSPVSAACALPQTSTSVALPGRPYAVTAAADGCSFYVSYSVPAPAGGAAAAASGGVALVSFVNGAFAVTQTAALSIQPQGMTLSRDGALLVAPGVEGVAFVDTAKLAEGAVDAASVMEVGGKGPIQASITPDGKLVFVSVEFSDVVLVIDLVKARANGFKPDAIVGKIPTDTQPLGHALSPDGKYLYLSVEVAKPQAGLTTPCAEPPGRGNATPPAPIPEGLISVIDVGKAVTDPARAIIASAPAGCRPVRTAISADGKRVYVAARASGQIVAFDTDALRAGKGRIAALKLPANAIGETLSRDGATLYAGTADAVSVIDARTLTLIGRLPPGPGAGAREMTMTSGGLLLATSGNRLDIINPAAVQPAQ